MSNVIDITALIANLNRLNEQEDQILITFLAAIKEYSELLLSKKDRMTKLLESLHLIEKINPVFLNVYFLFGRKNPTEAEKRVIYATERLRLCTDEYYGLLEHDMSEDELIQAVKYYEKRIINLAEEYKRAMKEVVRSEMIETTKKGTP